MRKAYVTRSTDHVDQPVRRLNLTEMGRAMLAHDPTRRLERVIESLTPETREDFVRPLGLILENLSRTVMQALDLPLKSSR